MASGSRRTLLVLSALLVAFAYFVTGRLGLLYPAVGSSITMLWLPTGIAVGAILRLRKLALLPVFAGSCAVNLSIGTPLLPALCIALGSTLGPLATVFLLRRFNFRPSFSKPQDSLLLGAAALAGMLISASGGVSVLAASDLLGATPLYQAWLTWWAGDTLGVILGAPLVLTFARAEWSALIKRKEELFIWALCTVAICVGVFIINKGVDGRGLALAYIPLLFVAWAALRFGTLGAALSVVATCVIAALATGMGSGPFQDKDPMVQAVVVWIYMATTTTLAWMISVMQTSRDRAFEGRRLFERALSDSALGVILTDQERIITYCNDGFKRLTGYSENEAIGRDCNFLQGRETSPETKLKLRSCLDSVSPFEDEILNYRKDGSRFWNNLTISPIHDEFGGLSGFIGIQRDVSERKVAEQALLESARRYRTLFNANPQPMWVHDTQTNRILAVNSAAVTHYGYSREEFLTFTTETLVVASGAEIAGTDAARIERHRMKDHSVIEAEITSHELEFDGQPARLVMAIDVTERRRTEIRTSAEREVLELLASESELQRVLDCITINQERAFPGMLCSILLLDDNQRTLRHGSAPSLPEAYCRAIDGGQIGPNAGSCGTAAYSRKTVIAEDIATDPRWKDYAELALSYGLRACWSVPLISSGDLVLGTLALYYREPAHPTELESAAIARSAHFASIAIERQKLRRSVHESRVRLETLVQNLPGMAYRCRNDENWTMTYVSDGCQELTGYRRDELENNKTVAYADLIHPDDRDWLWKKCQASLDARIPCTNEYRIIHRDGTERWVAERASGEYEPDGRLSSVDGFIQDITATHRAEQEREQLDRKMQEAQKLESLGVLAGGIAHDFNNLLTSILGNASIANLSIPAGSDAYNSVDQIITASMRAADLCKQMLAYSGRGRFVLQRLNLSELVEQTTQMLQISISKKAVLRFHLENSLPAIEVDATQIRQIVMNLVINASEAIGDRSGVISLSTGLTRVDRDYLRGTLTDENIPEGDYVFLEISDSGCGMSAETRAKIFDPFFTTKFTGRGLGLAAVLGIVRGHHGALKVYSEPGRGTTFKILFPVAGGVAEQQQAATTAPTQKKYSGTVLIIDDEETIRSTIARMMSILGFDCILAADGREGVEIAAKDPSKYMLVLLDLTMPHMDGEQTFTELRRLRPDFRVVLMSGFNAQEALLRFSGKGLASFLQKPFTFAGLKAVLGEVFA